MTQLNDSIQELLMTISAKPDTKDVVISLVWALLLTAILWFSYRFANTKKTYRPQFAATLVTLAVISTVLMDLIQSNLALSLGMLGSLSIVRFRTDIRDPRDVGFVFWSMAIGLAASTQSYGIGLIGSIVLAIFMILSARRCCVQQEMMLVVRGSNADIRAMEDTIEDECLKSEIRAKNILSDSFELVYTVSLPNKTGDYLIERLFRLGGVDSVNLLAEKKPA